MIDLNRVSAYRVLFVGDMIMDEYVYVRVIGKAVKENALSAVRTRTEKFRGGVAAAAAHAQNFCLKVDVWHGSKTMYNSRMVDDVYLRKLFVTHELYETHSNPPTFDVPSYDLVVVCDFGHGTMTKELIERLTREARFLAVNAQTNATNYGFNVVTKYPRADFVVIDELEARLAARDRDSPIEDVILKLGFPKIIITRGIHGAIGFDGAFERQAAMTTQVTDSIGAGDAFLAVTAPFSAAGLSMKEMVRIGNAAGAIKCGIIGHRSSVTKEALIEFIRAH